MPNLPFYFCLSLLITWPTHHTSCKPIGSHRRKLLHQPFSPLDSLPPSEPPSPSPPLPPNPKYPFSASPSPPSNSPFFPSFSAPPPPPSPSTFATFPANISSLILPHTSSPKPTSHKLVIAALTAVASAALIIAVIVFLFIRRKKNRNFSDDKTSRSGNSHRFFQANAETSNGTTTTTTHKLRSSSTSSEFLYLGTLVSSRRIDDRPDSRGNRGGKIVLDTRKLDSPELYPLPPLTRQCSRLNCGNDDKGLINCGNMDVGSSVEDEEEFYSPRGSLGGRESSSGTGSGSRRVMETMVGESFVKGRSSSASSSSSYSSSSSRSPSRSHSNSISPPVCLSPRIPEFKSPECSMFQSPQPLPQQNVVTSLVDQRSVSESASPERVLENIPAESPRLSKASERNVRSPSLSPMSSSPDRDMERHSGALDRNVGSPSLYSLSLSPERGLEENPDALLPESAGSDLIGRASSLLSLSSLPERILEKNPDASPKVSVDLDGNGGSTSVSTLSSSPERGLGKNSDASSKVSVDLDRNGRSTANSSLFSSPERCLEKNPDSSLRLWIASDRSKHSDTPSLSSSSPDRVIEGSIVRSLKSSYSSDVKGKKFSAPRCLSSEIAFAKTSDVPPRNSNVFDRISFELDPSRRSFSSSSPSSDSEHNSHMSLRRSNKVFPVIMGSDLRQPLSIPILQRLPPSPSPPPPPPPPSSRPRKHWAVPCPSTPVGHSSLPESDSEHNSDATPMASNVLNQNAESRIRKHWEVPCSSTALEQSSSSESDSDHCSDASPRTSKVSDQNGESGVRIRSDLKQPISVTPPPPPPPLPPPLPLSSQSQKHWAIPSPSTPVGQPICRPPALTAPSRPFVIQNPPKIDVSPVELPPSSEAMETVEETPKLRLKALHWDKVRASSDREMVWDQLRSSSFKLNEEMIETLFVFNTPRAKPKETTPRPAIPSPNTENRVLDPKKSQNISILLRAINVTIDEVCEALLEGNADALGTELLESLLKMAPTKEEERKLKEYKDNSPFKLGPAEKFLKALLDVPFAFRRVDAMLYISNFDSELEYLKKSFETLEAACEELRNSRMFMKLLEAVLKTGNRMNVGTNRGDAHAFKLDTLLKLADVKGADGKTTLLHFVVQEIIRTEGSRPSVANQAPSSTLSEDVKCRKLGLRVVSGLSSDLTNVKKAAAIDSDVLSNDVSKLSTGLSDIEEVIKLNQALESDESRRKFSESMKKFMKMAEEEIIRIQAQESVAMSLVKEITEYFHGNSAKEEAHPFRIFTVVRDFLTVLDRVCKEVGMINERTIISSAHKFPVPINPTLPQVVAPALHGKRQYNSSDDDSP